MHECIFFCLIKSSESYRKPQSYSNQGRAMVAMVAGIQTRYSTTPRASSDRQGIWNKIVTHWGGMANNR